MVLTNIRMSFLDVKDCKGGNSRLILLLAREPLKHSNADLSNAKDTLALIQDMVVTLLSPFFVASNSASLLWYRLHSATIPPVMLKTNGMNVACSTSRIRLAYWRFFSVSCCLYICFRSSPVRVCIWVANSHIKESRPLPLPASPCYYIQSRIWCGVGSPIQLFSCDVL